jgi:hypothetical protein
MKKIYIFFVTKANLCTLGTITLPELKIFNVIIFGTKVGIEDLTFNFPHFEGPILVYIYAYKVQEFNIAH